VPAAGPGPVPKYLAFRLRGEYRAPPPAGGDAFSCRVKGSPQAGL